MQASVWRSKWLSNNYRRGIGEWCAPWRLSNSYLRQAVFYFLFVCFFSITLFKCPVYLGLHSRILHATWTLGRELVTKVCMLAYKPFCARVPKSCWYIRCGQLSSLWSSWNWFLVCSGSYCKKYPSIVDSTSYERASCKGLKWPLFFNNTFAILRFNCQLKWDAVLPWTFHGWLWLLRWGCASGLC